MVKSHKTVIGNIKQICEEFDYSAEDNGEPTLQSIQEIVNAQLGYICMV